MDTFKSYLIQKQKKIIVFCFQRAKVFMSVLLFGEIKAQELFFMKSFQSNWGIIVEKTKKIQPFSYQFNTFLLDVYNVPGTVLGTEGIGWIINKSINNKQVGSCMEEKGRVQWHLGRDQLAGHGDIWEGRRGIQQRAQVSVKASGRNKLGWFISGKKATCQICVAEGVRIRRYTGEVVKPHHRAQWSSFHLF